MKNIFLFILFISIAGLGSHAQTTGERLIGACTYTVYNNALFPNDSVAYTYSGSRNIDSTEQGYPLAFDRCYRWVRTHNTFYVPVTNQLAMEVKTWAPDGNEVDDSSFYWNHVTGQYFYSYDMHYIKNVNHRDSIDLYCKYDTLNHSWDTIDRTTNTYYPQSLNVEYQLTQNWDTTTHLWDTAYYYRFIYLYDTAGHLISYTDSVLYNHVQTSICDLYGYDSLGHEIASVRETLSGISSIYVNSIDSFRYDSQGDKDTDYYWYPLNYGPLRNTEITVYQYNGLHQMVTSVGHSADTFHLAHPIDSTHYTYDSYGMQTIGATMSWDTSSHSWVPYFTAYYYYETYIDSSATGPNDIANVSTGDVRIYPVPAAGILSIDIKWDEAQAATISIYDASGRKYSETQTPYSASYHGYLPAANLPEGLYFLSVKGEKGSIEKSFNVVR